MNAEPIANVWVPERGSSNDNGPVGKVVINGNPYTPAEVEQIAKSLTDMAAYAKQQGTIVKTLPTDNTITEGAKVLKDGMTLTRPPSGSWMGTFQLAARRLVEDVVSDGPIELMFVADPEDGYEETNSLVEIYGTVVSFTDGHVVFEDGYKLYEERIGAVVVVG